ncbi:MAG: IclR family transcriptional regulator [Spirochaetaceae bacterium]|jgi:DNA-binding IclR family transcriptional regulator|nr:IclR family transcriptional regulator [Spirochaetaceae bacterium]
MRHITGVAKKTQTNQSSEKLFSIIELLAETDGPMRLLDISKALHINTSTALRFLNTMLKCGYVMQDADSLKYYLTFKICTVANKISSRINIRTLAAPYLRDLSGIFGESVCLSVDQNMKVVYIDVVEGPDQMIRSMQRIGSVAPLHCTAVGKLFLSEYSPENLEKVVAAGLARFTPNTLTGKSFLEKELAQVRRRGYAIDNEECEIGARCVSCPVRDHTGKIIAGISVTGPAIRLTDDLIAKKINHLIKAAEKVSLLLGCEGSVKNTESGKSRSRR